MSAQTSETRQQWIARRTEEVNAQLPSGDGEFRVLIAGGRDFSDKHLFQEKVTKLLASKLDSHNITVISGGAKGADTFGELWAAKNGHSFVRVEPDWSKFGRSAGHVRNEVMGNVADACIVFWDGKSRGTAGMIAYAQKIGLPLRIVQY